MIGTAVRAAIGVTARSAVRATIGVTARSAVRATVGTAVVHAWRAGRTTVSRALRAAVSATVLYAGGSFGSAVGKSFTLGHASAPIER